MKSLAVAVDTNGNSSEPRRPLVRLLGIVPALLLLGGLFAVWAGPLAAPVAATSVPSGTVVAWGYDHYHVTEVPAGLTGVTAIATGTFHTLALRSNRTVVGWGVNDAGQRSIPAGLSGVTAIAAGRYHSLALKSDGTVVAWGDAGAPQSVVPAGLTGVTAIAAGGDHSLALKSDGTVVAWGANYWGEINVPAGLMGVTAIAAGGGHSLALKSNGTVVAWGHDYYGAINVPAGLSGVVAIAAGYEHSLALKSDGTVVAWGNNDSGQTNVPAGLTGVTAIAAGGSDSLALKSDGAVVAWGYNVHGESTVPIGLSSVTAIAMGYTFSVALQSETLAVSTANPALKGVAQNVTVTARNVDGNIDTAYSGRIHFTSSDPSAGLPTNYTFVPGDAGVHTFSLGLTLKTAGTQLVRASDTVTRSITGVQIGIVVAPGPAATLAVSTANPYVAGASHSLTVTARDAYGNVATGYRGTIRIISSDPAAVLPADYTFTAADAGVHVFTGGFTLKTLGSQSVTATDTTTGTITGVQSGIAVASSGAAVTLKVSTANPFVAGAGHTVTVTAKDAYGNTATGYLGTIHLTSTDAQAVLPADHTFVAGDAGVYRVVITLKTAGSRSVTATDMVTATITGSQTGITVTPGTARSFTVMTANPSVAGVANAVTVTAKDACGNTATGYLGTIHFASTDRRATLPADYKFLSSDEGVHAFSGGIVLKTAGSQSVTASDTVTASIKGSQTGITVNPGAGSFVVKTANPYVHGVSHSVTITALDAYGNVATGYLGTVHLTSSDGAAILPADYTFVVGDNGVHVLTLKLKTVGTQTVTATDTSHLSIIGSQTVSVS